MTEGGPPGMSFPQKVHTEDEDFVIELDDSHLAGHHDMYGMDDRSRCKRRKRCGQCGPCQVKENCMKCHFCIRKDVLKQTCIYRKCVYLRSKPKPYSRSLHQSPPGRGSPPRDVIQQAPVVKSPPVAPHPGMSFQDTGIHMPDARPENHPYFPAQIPQQPNVAPQHNNGYISPPNPVMDARTPSLPNHTAGTPMNMQMSVSPHVQNNATSPPIQKHPDASSPVVPHPVNSPMAAIHGIPPPISSSNASHIPPSMHHMGPTIPPVFPPMSSNSLSSIPHVPSLSNIPGITDRSMNDFRTPDQFSLTPHHPLPHYPSVHPHPHMTHRDTGLFGDPSRMSHMNFNPPNIDSFSRGPNDSSCMYHPGLPYSMPGHLQPSGPSFISGATDMNPFRSNFLNSFPPGYTYPPDRYRDGFGSLGFPRLGMPSSAAAFSQYASQGHHGYGMGNTFSQQYLNSQHGCPKNGSRPPVSPSIDDVKVLQEGYLNDENNKKSKTADTSMNKPKLTVSDTNSSTKRNSVHRKRSNLGVVDSELMSPKYSPFQLSPRREHLQAWADFYLNRSMARDDFDSRSHRSLARSDSSLSRSSSWEPWKLSPFYSPRRDDVRSHASSSTLSDFECEVISVDDHQMNALIRSDGCNSIEIEFDNSSFCSSEGLSPMKHLSRNLSSDLSPCKTNTFEPIEKHQTNVSRSLWFTSHKNSSNPTSCLSVSSDKPVTVSTSVCTRPSDTNVPSTKQSKVLIDVPVIIRQDLDEVGIVQLEIPGGKLAIEDVVLDKTLQDQCSNIEELKSYLQKSEEILAA